MPAPGQIVERHWDWKLSDAQWREAMAQKGEDKKEDVKFDLWQPEDIGTARGSWSSPATAAASHSTSIRSCASSRANCTWRCSNFSAILCGAASGRGACSTSAWRTSRRRGIRRTGQHRRDQANQDAETRHADRLQNARRRGAEGWWPEADGARTDRAASRRPELRDVSSQDGPARRGV